ncbi:uncharacterized protein [Halyomorpha halys]|uniref:uncharacterized protein n=1 Tax=Halyomorpha halys TaxID=286706 RepID=UPI0006D4F837|nr:uncharacterized protein LOC106690665 [Halyomorpha halys]XP_014291668.1 uncharacterized protein LOC106690665 [Halyomorpha halys]XP_014291675.1 uncharacterized protein LOC106690665 [Halyomorpha halys]
MKIFIIILNLVILSECVLDQENFLPVTTTTTTTENYDWSLFGLFNNLLNKNTTQPTTSTKLKKLSPKTNKKTSLPAVSESLEKLIDEFSWEEDSESLKLPDHKIFTPSQLFPASIPSSSASRNTKLNTISFSKNNADLLFPKTLSHPQHGSSYHPRSNHFKVSQTSAPQQHESPPPFHYIPPAQNGPLIPFPLNENTGVDPDPYQFLPSLNYPPQNFGNPGHIVSSYMRSYHPIHIHQPPVLAAVQPSGNGPFPTQLSRKDIISLIQNSGASSLSGISSASLNPPSFPVHIPQVFAPLQYSGSVPVPPQMSDEDIISLVQNSGVSSLAGVSSVSVNQPSFAEHIHKPRVLAPLQNSENIPVSSQLSQEDIISMIQNFDTESLSGVSTASENPSSFPEHIHQPQVLGPLQNSENIPVSSQLSQEDIMSMIQNFDTASLSGVSTASVNPPSFPVHIPQPQVLIPLRHVSLVPEVSQEDIIYVPLLGNSVGSSLPDFSSASLNRPSSPVKSVSNHPNIVSLPAYSGKDSVSYPSPPIKTAASLSY